MSKRKLTRQQAWRVEKIQQERADRAGRRARQVEEELASGALGDEREGVITAHFGGQVAVETRDTADVPEVLQRCHLRANLERLVTGDRVVWRPGAETGVVVAQLPRDSVLQRPDSSGQLKPVAANVEQILVVIAARPQPHADLIDRYLVAAETTGIKPLIVLNKTDLLLQDEAAAAEVEALLAPYPGIGYPVLRASTVASDGLAALHRSLAGKTSVFAGQSGVGKSSLVNALLPGLDLRVGELSGAAGKGRHTTTAAQLFHLPAGGCLIDSPGIREFGLTHLDRESIELGFREFRPFLGRCRFRNCSHTVEPGCALLGALEAGNIVPQRFASYQQLLAELDP